MLRVEKGKMQRVDSKAKWKAEQVQKAEQYGVWNRNQQGESGDALSLVHDKVMWRQGLHC